MESSAKWQNVQVAFVKMSVGFAFVFFLILFNGRNSNRDLFWYSYRLGSY